MRRSVMAGLLCWCVATPVAAQTAVTQAPGPDRPGPWVVDVRGTFVSLPNDAAFFPDVPSSTLVPSRGYGLDAGVHIYVLQLGPARLGIGGSLLRARGTAAPGQPEDGEDGEPGEMPTSPETASLVTIVGPQLSMNFGSRDGWSYLSAGVGRAQMSTRASAFVDEDGEAVGAEVMEHGSRSTLNFGAGARWFARPRLAFSFDVRFHIIGAGGQAKPTPRTTLVAASVGISLR